MNGIGDRHVKRNKPDSERLTSDVFSFLGNSDLNYTHVHVCIEPTVAIYCRSCVHVSRADIWDWIDLTLPSLSCPWLPIVLHLGWTLVRLSLSNSGISGLVQAATLLTFHGWVQLPCHV